ncbi:MAG: amino acid adenylation domain-containing protein [Blastocatellales bacterium]
MTDLSNVISSLSPEKRALLALKLKERGGQFNTFPLSFAQRRLWFLDQMNPGSAVYNIPAAIRLTGSLNTTALERSLDEIVSRHEILRTSFTSVDGNPMQVVASKRSTALKIVDLSALPEKDREAKVLQLVACESQQSFDLARDQLLKIILFRLSGQEHVLLAVMHHIISDGWSAAVLIHEVAALYRAFTNGKPSPLPRLALQYADFAKWQQQWLQGENLEKQLGYWTRQMEGCPPVLELPTDRPRPVAQSHRGAHLPVALSRSASDSLKTLSNQEGVTLFMALLAAFQTLLHYYTGQEDICVSTPIANRNRAEMEGLIGFFVNTLIMRADLSGNPSFRDLLKRVRDVALGAYAHQDLPFERLVEELQPVRDLSHSPLAQVAFTLQNAPVPLPEVPGLTLSLLKGESGIAKTDLTLILSEGPEGLSGAFEYSTDLFDSTTIARMATHFQTLLERIAADPEQSLSALSPLPERIAPAKTQTEEFDQLYERSNLTKNQLLIWVGQQLQPELPLYNNSAYTFALSGEIDRAHFQKAFQALVNSSDALRTVIEEIDGIPQQRVIADFRYEMDYLDFSALPDSASALQTWARERCRIPFDFSKRLFDSALIKISEGQFVWYLNQHQIVTDGRSIWLIFKLQSELYQRSLNGELEERVALPAFQDYLNYEREYYGSARYRKAKAYWDEKLAAELEPIRFYGKTRSARTTFVKRVPCELGFERMEKLKAIAGQKEIFAVNSDLSLFVIFTALLFAYLHRISGNRSLSLGVLVHNRQSKAFKETIGLFMQMCPLRITIEEGDTFLSLIHKARVEIFETLQHRQYTTGNPLKHKSYDVTLDYHISSFAGFNGAPMRTALVHSGHEHDSFGLQVHDFDLSGSLTLDFDFNRDVFGEEQRGRAIQHFLNLLDSFLEDSAQPLHRAKLLPAEERNRILVEFNQTKAAYPADQTVVQLFEAQARKTPDQPAVVFEGQSLTYAQLNARANQLAHHLQTVGVGPDALVGLCVERSMEMPVGLLGILKAGGAYAPLDPAYPKDRLAFMLADAQARALVTQKRLTDRLPEHGAKMVLLDDDREIIARQSEENPIRKADADNLAYVIYTSGTTGKPKGVLIPHRAMLNHNVAAARLFGLQAGDRVLQFHSISFDAAVEEIFPTWLSGAALVLRDDAIPVPDSDLLRLIEREKLSVLNLPTAYWREWVSELARSGERLPDSLRLVIVGGDKATSERYATWRKLSGGGIRWINTYGPTEAAVIATFYEPTGDKKEEIWSEPPIGHPIANTQVYLLNHNLDPVPLGASGELCIGGDGLARGYLNRAESSAEKFISNPFSEAPGARLYKTGDLARYLPDGNIQFLGRIDQQVKVRGFRIEPGEIEAALIEHPAIREAAVVAVDDKVGDKRLIAYVALNDGKAPATNELRRFLRKKLPEYMTPSTFVMLESLPLSRSGKVDRQALTLRPLSTPELTRPEPEAVFEAPRTPIEEALSGIWANVLGAGQISIRDNFFDLGGHSLLVTQLISRLREAFQVEMAPRELFEAPTVAGLAERIEVLMKAGQGAPAPPIQPVSRRDALPLSFAQQRLWFIDQMEPGNPSYNMPGAVRLTGALNVAALEASLNEIIRRHESLRTTFTAVDGKPVQVIAPAQPLSLPVMDLSGRSEAEREAQVRKMAAEDALRPFDLAQGPLFRVRLLRLAAEEYVELFSMHHIISDEWSFGVLVRELAALYEAFCQGRPSPLPELPIQYGDFANWQRQWLQGETLDAHLAYWRQQLDGELPVMQLPFDHPRPVGPAAPTYPTYRGATHSFVLSPEVSAALKALSRQEGATLFMTLLAALQTLLHRHTGQDDIVVGTDVANRNRMETEGLIGFFINHLVLRTKLGGNPTFRQLLRRVREVTLGAYAHQDLPFDKLVGALSGERNLNHTPLFQMLFVFGNPAMPVLELPGLTLSPMRSDLILSKYDLTLFMSERGQEISGLWRYGAELFEAATISRMSDHLVTLLGSVTANPDARLMSLDMLTEAESLRQDEQSRARQDARIRKLKTVSRKSVDLSSTAAD